MGYDYGQIQNGKKQHLYSLNNVDSDKEGHVNNCMVRNAGTYIGGGTACQYTEIEAIFNPKNAHIL